MCISVWCVIVHVCVYVEILEDNYVNQFSPSPFTWGAGVELRLIVSLQRKRFDSQAQDTLYFTQRSLKTKPLGLSTKSDAS